MKEHLVRHGSKHTIQVHTTKRNKQQQKQKQKNCTHFQNKNNEKPEKRSLTKTKARGKNENRWVHSLTHIHRHALAHPPSHTHIEEMDTSPKSPNTKTTRDIPKLCNAVSQCPQWSCPPRFAPATEGLFFCGRGCTKECIITCRGKKSLAVP